ncbi:hypothetical protein OG562_22695 [Streptomyces sp. NBC_01275]|uniref:hypothetical protein n=1 Tax=Streptomyces sp. NBC_01275 TaxID=2903807 RepID=UPI00224CA78E|nr:hypothetical protein [Streptomyces sp. NBC_01275]MCX4763720.1 hypothetical protein [Streptomyces sp. NBC_01275]
MLRSVLVAAFSTVVAIGTLGGLAVAKGDARADGASPATVVVAAAPGGEDTSVHTDDSIWS